MDSDDLKNATVDRTLSQPSPGYQTGVGVSTSTSSLMVVASTAAGSTSTTVVTAAGGLGTHVDPSSGSTVPDQHCPYNILHLLSHLRQPEARSQPSNSTRELVMRVTTVWGVSCGLISHGGERFITWLSVLERKKKFNLNCTGLIPCCCLFQNASLMSLHGLNKSQSCFICRVGWKAIILDIWGKKEICWFLILQRSKVLLLLIERCHPHLWWHLRQH